MKQIRNNIFETNSSSTHSICITTENLDLDIPEKIEAYLGEFGWEIDTLNSIEEKLSYLYTGLIQLELREEWKKIKKTLSEYTEVIEIGSEEQYFYVDHYYDLQEFLIELVNDEDLLLNYLFSIKSYVLTGNDNSDCDIDIKESYPHRVYYKGN